MARRNGRNQTALYYPPQCDPVLSAGRERQSDKTDVQAVVENSRNLTSRRRFLELQLNGWVRVPVSGDEYRHEPPNGNGDEPDAKRSNFSSPGAPRAGYGALGLGDGSLGLFA